jgi:U3 small nucleolar RNA-associated protein 11
MASAWKNAVQRREHRERPQPEERKHLGLLEKHKDYVKRARSFHRKQDRLTALKRRAEMKNTDEFYHKMHKLRTKVSRSQ